MYLAIRCFRIQIKERKASEKKLRNCSHTLCTEVSSWVSRVKVGTETNRKIKQTLRDIELLRKWSPGKKHQGQV